MSRSDDESESTAQNLLYLNPGRTWNLQNTINSSKLNLGSKYIYSCEYQGLYRTTTEDKNHLLNGITEYPVYKKIHSMRQTHPPKHRQDYFEKLIPSVMGYIEGNFSEDKKKLTMTIHFGKLYSSDNWVLEHYFSSQQMKLERH